jgi:hypothetical protein
MRVNDVRIHPEDQESLLDTAVVLSLSEIRIGEDELNVRIHRVNFNLAVTYGNRLVKALHACQKEGVRVESHGVPRIQLQSAAELPFRSREIVIRVQSDEGGCAMRFRQIIIKLERLQGRSLCIWKS